MKLYFVITINDGEIIGCLDEVFRSKAAALEYIISYDGDIGPYNIVETTDDARISLSPEGGISMGPRYYEVNIPTGETIIWGE